MNSVLTVSATDLFKGILTGFALTAYVKNCGEARRMLLERDFDLAIINAPLRDETGEGLARTIAASGMCQVILAVAAEHFDEVSAACEGDGVLTIAKPINKAVFLSAINLARASQNRLLRVQAENARLKRQIQDIRVVDRAKHLLTAYLRISEQEAHRYIEKQAMDTRVPRRKVAEGIIKAYET